MNWLSLFGGHWWRWRQRVESDLIGIRHEAARIEDKADAALDKTAGVAQDAAVMLKKAADAVTGLAKQHHSMQTITERQEWLAQESNKQAEYLLALHDWMKKHHGGSYTLHNPMGGDRMKGSPNFSLSSQEIWHVVWVSFLFGLGAALTRFASEAIGLDWGPLAQVMVGVVLPAIAWIVKTYLSDTQIEQMSLQCSRPVKKSSNT